ncbi:unnamed protein product [Fraxinus pennsylvanica]|uniref:Major facilitator superfamily (MFS) profile domain-containing protein n=1 Tax=Fraxinus pennsylvanica TaxID=56036 RepID=A0AAD2DZ25_9LAMI|nr:unnamed protein product [Fraxinus pennsylvanica]
MTSAEPPSSGQPYRSKMTVYVVACWIFAAFGLCLELDLAMSQFLCFYQRLHQCNTAGLSIFCINSLSLIEHGKEFEGKEALRKIRGVDDVESELEMIKLACEIARQVKHPYKKLFKRVSMPPLIIGISVQVFQQFPGINAIMFYAPVLFQTVGFKSDGSLLSAIITGVVNVLSTIVSIVVVDRVGRRKLLLQACVQMFISMVAIGSILLIHLKPTGSLDKGLAAVVVVLVCLFVMSFAWSWGPMGGVTSMDDFLKKFFPVIYERKLHAKENNYCKYDDQLLQLFTSSLYLAALVASFGASKACNVLGRKPTIGLASILFILGAIVSGIAPNKALLIIGRILFGIGVGFGNEVLLQVVYE